MGVHKNEQILPPLQWRSLTALLLSLFAQTQLEPPAHLAPAVVFYFAAAGFLVWALIVGEWKISSSPQGSTPPPAPPIRRVSLLASLPLLALSFYFFSGNRFTAVNLLLWLAGIFLFMYAWWVPGAARKDQSID